MFEKHKMKKMERERGKELDQSMIAGERPEREEKREYRSMSRRREIARAMIPGSLITLGLGFAIYLLAEPLGAAGAIGTTITVLIATNIMMYLYTNKIYIPAGVDFAVYGRENPDDLTSTQVIGMWRVPTALLGSLRKDEDVPLKACLLKPADSSMSMKDRVMVTSLYYTQSDLNKLKSVRMADQLVYKVNNFRYDEETGEITITPTIYYGHDDYDTLEGLMDELQHDLYHTSRAHTLLKLNMPRLVERGINQLLPTALKRLMHAKYDAADAPNPDLDKIEKEIRDEEEKVSPQVRNNE